MSYSLLFKCILIGDDQVGKTNLLRRFVDKSFNEYQDEILAPEFKSKIISIYDKEIKLQIWDVSGKIHFWSLSPILFRATAALIFIYDITNRDTFSSLSWWVKIAKQTIQSADVFILIGNKTDLGIKREVLYEEGQTFANQNTMFFLETSAKYGYNVENAFKLAAAEALENWLEKYGKESFKV